MAKKPSMPDFTFALGADLREAAAKMRKMSQPPKHQSAQQSDDEPTLSDDIQDATVEDSTLESPVIVEPILVAKSNLDAASTSDAPEVGSPHCEGSSVSIESEESTSPVDSIDPVIDAVQPLEGPKTSEMAEQEPSAVKTEASPVPSCREFIAGSPEMSNVEVGKDELEVPQSVPLEALLEDAQSVYVPESSPTGQSKTVSDSYSQQEAAPDSCRCAPIEPNSHQQSHDNNSRALTDDDTFSSKPPHSEGVSSHSPEIGSLTSVTSHSMYSLLSYGQPQTVTDYQIYSTAKTMPPHDCGEISTLPRNPFQPKAVEPKTSAAEQSSARNDSHQLPQTAIVTDHDKQSVAPKGFYQSQPSAAQPDTAHGISPSIIAATLQDAHLGGARQVLLDALTALRQQSPQVVVNLKRLAPAIGLSYGTVRNTISRLVREGVICTTQVRTGDAHGVCVEFIDDNPLPSMTVPARSRQSMPYHHQSPTVTKSNEPNPPVPMNDTCIWDTDAALIAILWPFAADAGFGPAHLAQLRRAYQLQGWEPENVSRCLRYLDWELSNGVSAGHEHVSTWLRIMQRQGHYPRPEGYVEPEILRLRQQAEEERELAEARNRFK